MAGTAGSLERFDIPAHFVVSDARQSFEPDRAPCLSQLLRHALHRRERNHLVVAAVDDVRRDCGKSIERLVVDCRRNRNRGSRFMT